MSEESKVGRGFGWTESSEVQERRTRVQVRATEVFGNDYDASLWLSSRTSLGPPGFWGDASDLAAASEEGCLAVLVQLDELDPITEKKPLPESIRRARAGVRPGRRRKSDFK